MFRMPLLRLIESRVGGVAGDKGVVDALPGLGEAGEAPELPQGGKQLLPAGQGLVDVALMAHIEHQPVRGGVEHPVDGHRQLHHAQIGGQVPSGPGDTLDQKFPQLGAQGLQLGFRQSLHVSGGMDGFQNQG